jgi:hypothetical protein
MTLREPNQTLIPLHVSRMFCFGAGMVWLVSVGSTGTPNEIAVG